MEEIFLKAVRDRNIPKVRELLREGVNKSIINDGLLAAGVIAHHDMIGVLLDAGANVNAKDGYGVTPLLYASTAGDEGIVKILLDAGANVNAKDDDGFTPLIRASSIGHNNIVRLLLNKGGDINAKNNDGTTPLAVAATNRHVETVRLLLKNGARIDRDYTLPLALNGEFGADIRGLIIKAVEEMRNIKSRTTAATLRSYNKLPPHLVSNIAAFASGVPTRIEDRFRGRLPSVLYGHTPKERGSLKKREQEMRKMAAENKRSSRSRSGGGRRRTRRKAH